MKAETTLVRAESRIELNSISTIDLNLVLVVLPNNTELDDALGNGNDLEGGLVLGLLVEEGAVLEGRSQLCEVAMLIPISKSGAGEQLGWSMAKLQPELPNPGIDHATMSLAIKGC